MLHLRVTSYKAIKLKLLQVRRVQVRDALALVGDQDALLRAECLRTVNDADVAVLVCRVRLLLDVCVQVHLEFLDRLSFFGQLASVDARYKKASVIVGASICLVLGAPVRWVGL